MYLQKKMYVIFIRYLESITQAISAYFGLDSRECVFRIFIIYVFI
jgi:hypothetical protein